MLSSVPLVCVKSGDTALFDKVHKGIPEMVQSDGPQLLNQHHGDWKLNPKGVRLPLMPQAIKTTFFGERSSIFIHPPSSCIPTITIPSKTPHFPKVLSAVLISRGLKDGATTSERDDIATTSCAHSECSYESSGRQEYPRDGVRAADSVALGRSCGPSGQYRHVLVVFAIIAEHC